MLIEKVYEKLIYKLLLIKYFLTDVEPSLLVYINFIWRVVDLRVQFDSIYTDFMKAFAKIDHVMLIEKNVCSRYIQKLIELVEIIADRKKSVCYC